MTLTHEQVTARLRGTTLRIPNLRSLFASWPPAAKNPHYDHVAPFVQDVIRFVLHAGPAHQDTPAQREADTQPQDKTEARLRDDLALLTSLMYPQAEPGPLRTLGTYMVWLVCWDDEADSDEGSLGSSFETAEAWRAETLGVARRTLLDKPESGPPAPPAESALHAVLTQAMSTIRTGEHGYAEPQRQRLYREIDFFVRSCSDEQRLRLGQTSLAYDAYMDVRRGTVGTGTLCALVEYAVPRGSSPPLPDSPARRTLERQVAILTGLINDLLSLRKELRTGCVINAVAALLTAERSPEDAVALIFRLMEDAVEALDRAAEAFVAQQGDPRTAAAADAYAAGCRAIVTGVLEFTLVSPRYNLAKRLANDGSLELVL